MEQVHTLTDPNTIFEAWLRLMSNPNTGPALLTLAGQQLQVEVRPHHLTFARCYELPMKLGQTNSIADMSNPRNYFQLIANTVTNNVGGYQENPMEVTTYLLPKKVEIRPGLTFDLMYRVYRDIVKEEDRHTLIFKAKTAHTVPQTHLPETLKEANLPAALHSMMIVDLHDNMGIELPSESMKRCQIRIAVGRNHSYADIPYTRTAVIANHPVFHGDPTMVMLDLQMHATNPPTIKAELEWGQNASLKTVQAVLERYATRLKAQEP